MFKEIEEKKTVENYCVVSRVTRERRDRGRLLGRSVCTGRLQAW